MEPNFTQVLRGNENSSRFPDEATKPVSSRFLGEATRPRRTLNERDQGLGETAGDAKAAGLVRFSASSMHAAAFGQVTVPGTTRRPRGDDYRRQWRPRPRAGTRVRRSGRD